MASFVTICVYATLVEHINWDTCLACLAVENPYKLTTMYTANYTYYQSTMYTANYTAEWLYYYDWECESCTCAPCDKPQNNKKLMLCLL